MEKENDVQVIYTTRKRASASPSEIGDRPENGSSAGCGNRTASFFNLFAGGCAGITNH